MKRILSLLFMVTLVLGVYPIAIQQTVADILPRVRCHFGKGVYAYGEPVIFYLDVDVFPNTLLVDIYLEELRPNGSSNIVDFGVLNQGSYEFTIGQAGPPPGYRQCTLISRKTTPNGFYDMIRWQGGYVVEADVAPTSAPAPGPTSSPGYTPVVPQSTSYPIAETSEQSALPLLIIIVIAVAALVLILGRASQKQAKSRK
jgi:hypothetical protein